MKCSVCGKRFRPKKDMMYQVRAISFIGVMYHECVDCPRCGCQHKVNSRWVNEPKGGKKNDPT